MSTERRRFSVSAPDWGDSHLSTDAVVAFVDDELAHRPHERAVVHVAACPECAGEVASQRQARSALRGAGGPAMPSSLLSSLRSIPQEAELPGPPVGLAVTASGELVSVVRPDALTPVVRPVPPGEPPEQPDQRLAHQQQRRRLRLGTTAAVSGLALGALALGVGTVPAADVPRTPVERGVLGGSVLNTGVLPDARTRFDPVGRQIQDADEAEPLPEPFPEPLHRGPRAFLRHGLR